MVPCCRTSAGGARRADRRGGCWRPASAWACSASTRCCRAWSVCGTPTCRHARNKIVLRTRERREPGFKSKGALWTLPIRSSCRSSPRFGTNLTPHCHDSDPDLGYSVGIHLDDGPADELSSCCPRLLSARKPEPGRACRHEPCPCESNTALETRRVLLQTHPADSA